MLGFPIGMKLVLLSVFHLAAIGNLGSAQAGSSLDSRISAGASHTCGVTSSLRAKCWGSNLFGQLGDGTTIGRLIPVNVRRVGDVVKPGGISGGSGHTCALKNVDISNVVPWCWGANSFGQLGDGTTANSTLPKKVRGLGSPVRIRALATGTSHSCALDAGFQLWCWGRNDFGQLGDGTKTNRPRPVKVKGLPARVIDVVAGAFHTCALISSGRVKCWGSNGTGQLGDGTNVDRLEPVEVWKLRGVTSITAGFGHTCARTGSAVAKCWGYNFFGQLGDGTTESRSLPAAVRGLAEGALHVAAGSDHTCALAPESGAALCWGRNSSGQLGDGTTFNRVKPRYVVSLKKGVTAITAGANHTCAMKDDRVAKCWGSNSSGQLGDGTKTNRITPVTVIAFK